MTYDEALTWLRDTAHGSNDDEAIEAIEVEIARLTARVAELEAGIQRCLDCECALGVHCIDVLTGLGFAASEAALCGEPKEK